MGFQVSTFVRIKPAKEDADRQSIVNVGANLGPLRNTDQGTGDLRFVPALRERVNLEGRSWLHLRKPVRLNEIKLQCEDAIFESSGRHAVIVGPCRRQVDRVRLKREEARQDDPSMNR